MKNKRGLGARGTDKVPLGGKGRGPGNGRDVFLKWFGCRKVRGRREGEISPGGQDAVRATGGGRKEVKVSCLGAVAARVAKSGGKGWAGLHLAALKQREPLEEDGMETREIEGKVVAAKGTVFRGDGKNSKNAPMISTPGEGHGEETRTSISIWEMGVGKKTCFRGKGRREGKGGGAREEGGDRMIRDRGSEKDSLIGDRKAMINWNASLFATFTTEGDWNEKVDVILIEAVTFKNTQENSLGATRMGKGKRVSTGRGRLNFI